MKTANLRKLAAFLAAVLAGSSLLLSTLRSSDFPRGLYGPPDANHWTNIAELNGNRIWNYVWPGNAGLQAYLDSASNNGLKAVLRLDPNYYPTFYMQKYSEGLYHRYQTEWTYTYALTQKDGFYHFWHRNVYADPERGELDPDNPDNGASWMCLQGSAYGAGVMAKGPCETIKADGWLGHWNSQVAWPDENEVRDFRSIFRVMADLQGLNPDDEVFQASLYKYVGSTATQIFSQAFTCSDFGGASLDWKDFAIDYELTGDEYAVYYEIYWYNNCDFWVDWVEFMDMDRAYYLFYHDEDDNFLYRDNSLQQIESQCDGVETGNEDKLAGWKQSDEPPRSAFLAHGVVNDMARTSLLFPPATPLNVSYWSVRPELFILLGKAQIVDTEVYPYAIEDGEIHYLGSQVELDTLADRLERTYQACADTLPFHFTGQAHYWSGQVRNPTRSEILAETYMALAHGAKGITFFKYTSGPPTSYGLVDTNFQHNVEPYASKWQAVHDVFAQLDLLGNALLSWDLYAAYCAKDGGFVSPVDSIYFEDDDYDYIEVGQFHDASNADYLIIVNRRTDYDRHISVVTNLSGRYALRDLYTQEKFVSSTGDFEWIPFVAGEGRVFKLEQYIAEPQVQNITLDR